MFSIIVCSHRPERARLIREHYANLFAAHEHEIIIIDDARSLCEGYTRGFARSRGDLIIFSHDDIEFVVKEVPERVREHLRHFDLIGVSGTTRLIDGAWWSAGDPHCFMLVLVTHDGRPRIKIAGKGTACIAGVQALDGVFMACQREVVETVGFDSATFDGFHGYDLDFSFRAHLAKFELAICRDLALLHHSVGSFDAQWSVYRSRFEAKHRVALYHQAKGRMHEITIAGSMDELSALCTQKLDALLRLT